MEERFQNEEQRGNLGAAGRPAENTPSPLRSPRLSFLAFLCLYFGARAGAGAAATGPHRQKRFPLAFRIPTNPGFSRGCPRCPDSPLFRSAPGSQGKLRRGSPEACGVWAGPERILAWAASLSGFQFCLTCPSSDGACSALPFGLALSFVPA